MPCCIDRETLEVWRASSARPTSWLRSSARSGAERWWRTRRTNPASSSSPTACPTTSATCWPPAQTAAARCWTPASSTLTFLTGVYVWAHGMLESDLNRLAQDLTKLVRCVGHLHHQHQHSKQVDIGPCAGVKAVSAGRIAKLVGCWTCKPKGTGSIFPLTAKGAPLEQPIVSPCEIIKICWLLMNHFMQDCW
jgi:hypothetical protein